MRLRLPQGKKPSSQLGRSYFFAVENTVTLLSAKAEELLSSPYLRYLLESFNRNDLKQNRNVPVKRHKTK